MLVAAISGRALAASAQRAGLAPFVADFFADADTRRIAQECRKLGNLRRGFQWKALERALRALAENMPSPPLGLVYGAGFEDRTLVLGKIAEQWPLLGNEPGVVARVKSPEIFFAELARLGIPHPSTTMDAPAAAGWLAKEEGGAGGSHIVTGPVVTRGRGQRRLYFQEKVEGRAISALFVAAGKRARLLGFSDQWAAPTARANWRYGGAVRPAEMSRDLETRMACSVQSLVQRFDLKGLGSADFLVCGENALLLEVNPRPGATLDIFDSEAEPLLRLHLEAVLENRLPTAPLDLPSASAAAIVYATEPIVVPKTMSWPEWTADQPTGGECIDKDRPICTVLARAGTAPAARHLVEERISSVLAACIGQEGGPEWT